MSRFPARIRYAGDGLNQMMRAHLLKAAAVLAILSDIDRIDCRLHIVIDNKSEYASCARSNVVIRYPITT
jgi:hypothetical protein